MTIDQKILLFTGIITLISGIAAALTALATFRVVSEMSKQRQQSLRPQLYLSGVRFITEEVDCEYAEAKNVSILTKWRDTQASIPGGDDRIKLRMSNLGLGAAVNVRVTWYYPYKNTIDRVLDFARSFDIALPAEIWNRTGSVRAKAFDHDNWDEAFAYVLPSTIEKGASFLIIPNFYIDAVTIENYVHKVYFLKHDSTAGDRMSTPPLVLFVRFTDVEGNTYSQSYEIELGLLWVGTKNRVALSGEIRPSLRSKINVSDYDRIA